MARDQRATARDVMKMIREEEIRFLDLKFVDLIGTLQHLTVPAENVDEETFRTGFAFDGSSVKGFQKIAESDMLLMPDPSSVFRDPFFDDPALSVFCDIADPIRRAPYSRDPRGIAGRAERLARSLGIADLLAAQQARSELNRALCDLFDRYDLLLTPTVPNEAFAAAGPPPAEIEGSLEHQHGP